VIESLDSTFDQPLHIESKSQYRDYDITVEFLKDETDEALARFVDLEQFDKELDQVSRGFLRAFQRAPKIMVASSELYKRIDEIARARPENLEPALAQSEQHCLFNDEPSLATIETTVSELTLAIDGSIQCPLHTRSG
jgi:stress response protein YsnF